MTSERYLCATTSASPGPHACMPTALVSTQWAGHLPRSDSWRDDQDGQQPGLVQCLSHVGEHVDEAPVKDQENRSGVAGQALPCRHLLAGSTDPTVGRSHGVTLYTNWV